MNSIIKINCYPEFVSGSQRFRNKFGMTFSIKAVFGLFFLFGFTILRAQTPLQVYQDTAALNNPSIQALYIQYEAVKQRAPQIGALPDLQFGFGYFINAVETRVGPQLATFSASQSFPWFGQLDAQQKASVERANVVLEKFNSERSKISFEVATTYYSLYVLRSAIRITNENIVLLNTFKDLANVRFESGQGSMVNVLRVQMELAELENQLEYLSDSKQLLIVEFEKLLNAELTDELIFPEILEDVKLSVPKEQIGDSVKTVNPSILSLEHKILAYDQDVIAAQKIGAPSFTVGLNYTIVGELSGYTGEGNGKDIILPTIGVKIPLYRKKYAALIKEKEYAKQSVSLERESLANALTTDLAEAIRNYDDAVRRIKLNTRLESFASQAVDILLAEYSSAETNFEEVIRMNRKLLKYELELEKSRADQNSSVAYINYLMGK